MDFIGRSRELTLLNRQYASDSGVFIPVYGRRRVGKTTLLRRFCTDIPTIYHVGKEVPDLLQRKEFLIQAARVLDEPLLAEIAPPDWKALLTMIGERWKGEQRLIIVMDEFQWIAASSPTLPSTLQEQWDSQWESDQRIMLVLCGSYVGFMEREVLGAKSPLFGRRTAQIQLKPFGFREARDFHPPYSLTDAARAYFICGGVPAYLRAFRPDRSIEQNICESLLDDFAPLFREADFLLREELREVQNYHAILVALAEGSLPHGEIGARTSVPSGSISYYLSQLESLGYISKRYPLSGRRPAARAMRQELADPLLRFWFRFIFPNLSYLSASGAERTFERRVEPRLPAYFGGCFEALCREALPLLYEAEGVTASFEVGQYWSKEVQIDVVGHREDNFTDLGECKWGSLKPAAVARELEAKVGKYPNKRNATIGLRVFSKDAVKVEQAGARWHSLEELYNL
jgi:uncharacterized protein